MGTKNDPGDYDCYANAEPDEPMFILLARDETAQYFVGAWVAIRCGDLDTAIEMMRKAGEARKESHKKEPTDRKMVEAMECAKSMRVWVENKSMDAIERRCSK